MKDTIVTRFAPSPTGYMHIGNLRTALYSYLIAKANNGKFILRIEDTDRGRLVEDAVVIILKTLSDTGLNYDEGPEKDGGHGPYIQSERKEIYMKYAKILVKKGFAYYCFCDKNRLEQLQGDKEVNGYDRHCRNLSKEEINEKLNTNIAYVIRQKMPLDGTTKYNDLVFGEISMPNEELQDQILIKADGYPTYNFAHIVDDYLMGITHVVRGSEYLTSTSKYVLLYDAFGWERPQYVHLPLIMGLDEDGKVSKLSKRHGAVSFQDLVNRGFLPEAILNYIAFLGWSPKQTSQEIFNLEELCNVFSVDGINKSAAIFDYKKLRWINSKYIQNMSFEQYRKVVSEYESDFIKNHPFRQKIEQLAQGRIDTFNEINDIMSFLKELPEYTLDKFINKKNKVTLDNVKELLELVENTIEKVDKWDNDNLFKILSEETSLVGEKLGAVMWVARIAVSSMEVTPGGATEIMEMIGEKETRKRLDIAKKYISKKD